MEARSLRSGSGWSLGTGEAKFPAVLPHAVQNHPVPTLQRNGSALFPDPLITIPARGFWKCRILRPDKSLHSITRQQGQKLLALRAATTKVASLPSTLKSKRQAEIMRILGPIQPHFCVPVPVLATVDDALRVKHLICRLDQAIKSSGRPIGE